MIKWQEIIENSCNDELMTEYFEALEKKYRKSSGTISGFIFHNDLSVDEIMEKQKNHILKFLSIFC